MIVVDTEFSGLDYNKYGIWQIGAVELENPENIFLEESRLDDEDEANEIALKVVGKTEEELRDKSRQSQKEMLEHFFEWVKKVKIKTMVCQGPQWDFAFILTKAHKYGLQLPFRHRCFDLHTIAQTKYAEINGDFLIKENHTGIGLSTVLKFCGMNDTRINLTSEGKVDREGTPHNALEDAKLEAECFSRLIYGKNLLPEFEDFPIPEYLKKIK